MKRSGTQIEISVQDFEDLMNEKFKEGAASIKTGCITEEPHELSPKKRNYVYLAGAISEDDRTYLWREKFTKLIGEDRRVVIVNPCANKFNQDMRRVGNDGIEFIKEAMKRSQSLLKYKDYQLVKMVNVIVVNLELYSPEKPLIGTIFELDWADMVLKIPVIAVCGPKETQGNNPYVQHSWVLDCCKSRVETVEEAAEKFKTFFLEY